MVISQFYDKIPSAKKSARDVENETSNNSSDEEEEGKLRREVSIEGIQPSQEEGIQSSQSTAQMQVEDHNKDEEENTDDVIGIDVQLTAEELQEFTQKWNPFDDEGDDEVAEDAPAPIDFSQNPEMTQREVDEEEDNNTDFHYPSQPSSKRYRRDDSTSSASLVDSDDKWFLDDGREWKVFKRGEQFSAEPFFGIPEQVYTIQSFFRDRRLGKMATCQVSILADKTFLGEGNESFESKAFEKEFGSKYVGCRFSLFKPLKKLKHRVTQKVPDPILFFDPPTRETKGPGWTLAYSFDKSFGSGQTCLVSGAPTAIDMFAGAGGMGIGLEEAGFRITHAIEKDPIVAATLNLNHGQHTAVFPQDMETFFAEAKKAEEGSLYCCGHTSHGHASSPCQGFSRINTTGSEASKEKNNQLCLTWPEFIISQKMTTGSFENVTGMLDPKRVPYIQHIVNKFIMNRYQVRVGVLDSSHFGDPQKRERVIILVSKAPYLLPDLPKPTHGPNPSVENGLKPIKTPKDAIGDLEDVGPRAGPGLLVLPPPNSTQVTHHVRSDQQNYLDSETLDANKPARTVLCGHAIGHYNLSRACTNLEGARLQSFPDKWKFAGSHKQIQKQIGNAMPIGLATAVAKAAFEVYEDSPNWYYEESPPDVTPAPNPRRVTNTFAPPR